jgi:hypothetical protein
MSKPAPARYRTTNWKSYNAALSRRGSLWIWFDPGMQWLSPSTGKRAPTRALERSDPDLSDVESTAQAAIAPKCGHDCEPAGDGRPRLAGTGLQHAKPQAKDPACRNSLPFRFRSIAPAGRGAGIKAAGDGEWCAQARSFQAPPVANVHIGVDAGTLEIRVIESTGSRVGNAPMLPELLGQISRIQPIATVSADGAYDTKACHDAITARDACAVIPARRNARA